MVVEAILFKLLLIKEEFKTFINVKSTDICCGIKSGLNACDFDYAVDFILPRHHWD